MTHAGRNDPCPCGSGRKYKHCCLARAGAATAAASGGDAEALNRSAIALQRSGRLDDAATAYRRAIGAAPLRADLHFNLGTALQARGRLDAAIAAYGRAVALDPRLAVAHNNMGNALAALGRVDEAVTSYLAAVAAHSDFGEARYNLGVALHGRGDLEGAIGAYDAVIARHPGHAQAHYNRGNALRDLGRADEAAAAYRRAIDAHPAFAQAQLNLGTLLQAAGRVDEAIVVLRAAVESAPGTAEGWNNLGNALLESGQADASLEAYRRALDLDDRPELRLNLARCLGHANLDATDTPLRALVARAIVESWARPADLARAALRVLDATAAASGGNDPLLLAVLESAPVSDPRFERALTSARAALLDSAEAAPARTATADDDPAFACALARQCYVNDYVWCCADGEQARAAALRARIDAALATDRPVPALWIAAAGAYAPLAALDNARGLAARSWPPRVAALVAQQVAEPLEEVLDRRAIPALTAIADSVSRAVRQQYEESPYPRWTRVPATVAPSSLRGYLRAQFPRVRLEFPRETDDWQMLIAGCGTGQEAIEAAQQFPAAQVLAIDLSLASLAYARRKSRELGLGNVDYAQGDVLGLGSIDRRFDAISSVGVLHHLAEPAAGLRVLASMLRPGGFIRLGLYSALARGDVVAARAYIAARGHPATPDGIRRARAEFLAAPDRFGSILSRRDFYSTSECRDLLFHVQEHRFTLPSLAELLAATRLEFVGFLLEPQTRHAYRRRFPADPAGTDLGCWATFEAERPETFAGMYRFWARRSFEA